MEILVTILHIVSCLFLVFVILIQAGRGGGLSDMMGTGEQAQKIFGTQTNSFLVKLTTVSATCFIITSVSLAVITANKGKSLIRKPAAKVQAIPQPSVTDISKAAQEVAQSAAAVTETAVPAASTPVEEAAVPVEKAAEQAVPAGVNP